MMFVAYLYSVGRLLLLATNTETDRQTSSFSPKSSPDRDFPTRKSGLAVNDGTVSKVDHDERSTRF